MRFAFLFFLLIPAALATTFGPFPLVGQVENSPYVARGRASNRRVALDRDNQKPHTYWDFTVLEQMRGDNIGSNPIIRQPGGEVGEIGYRVSGTATFRENEEVVLMLRGTTETNVYDVVGYSSGKYTVKSGGLYLENSLGFPVTNAEGKRLTLEEFRAFVSRVNARDSTEEDRKIVLNRGGSHGHDDRSKEVRANTQQESFSQESEKPKENESLNSNSVQSNESSTDESSKGQSVGWWILLAIGGFALVAAWIYKRS